MKLIYRVHRATLHHHPKELPLADGRKVMANVPVLIVELIPLDQHDEAGAIKLAIDNDIAGAIAMYRQGSNVSLSVAVEP